jgi:hypothetical protein
VLSLVERMAPASRFKLKRRSQPETTNVECGLVTSHSRRRLRPALLATRAHIAVHPKYQPHGITASLPIYGVSRSPAQQPATERCSPPREGDRCAGCRSNQRQKAQRLPDLKQHSIQLSHVEPPQHCQSLLQIRGSLRRLRDFRYTGTLCEGGPSREMRGISKRNHRPKVKQPQDADRAKSCGNTADHKLLNERV